MEVWLACRVLNTMTRLETPDSYRRAWGGSVLQAEPCTNASRRALLFPIPKSGAVGCRPQGMMNEALAEMIERSVKISRPLSGLV